MFSNDAREKLLLASYAFPSRQTQGRKYPEASHTYRGPFQRDRDRIVHSAAFRRLSGKMQVFTGDMGDYHRTRLTHTMEVTSIARTIGRALRLNEDLIEALALMHDIGHPPYGHAGEHALNQALQHVGGFSHNAFALTLVEELENRYRQFPGLNLSHEVLEGQRCRVHKRDRPQSPMLEVQVVDMADSIAYDAHDIDDAVKLGLVTIDQLLQIELVHDAAVWVRERFGSLSDQEMRAALVHQLIELMVTSVLRHCQAVLAQLAWRSHQEATLAPPTILLEPHLLDKKRDLEQFLYHHVYRHPRLLAVRGTAQRQLREMVDFYAAHPEELPHQFRQRVAEGDAWRSATEYIAGMTDRFCTQQYEAIFGQGAEGCVGGIPDVGPPSK